MMIVLVGWFAHHTILVLAQQTFECRVDELHLGGLGRACTVEHATDSGHLVTDELDVGSLVPLWQTRDGDHSFQLRQPVVTAGGRRTAFGIILSRGYECDAAIVVRRTTSAWEAETMPRRGDNGPKAPPTCPSGDITTDARFGGALVRECTDVELGWTDTFGMAVGGITWIEVAAELPPDPIPVMTAWRCPVWGPPRGAARTARSYAVESTRDPATGALQIVQEFRDGMSDGRYVVLYDNGMPAVIGNYMDGVAQGAWVWLTPEGVPVAGAWFELGVPEDVPVVLEDR